MLYKNSVDSVDFMQNCQRKWLNVFKVNFNFTLKI